MYAPCAFGPRAVGVTIMLLGTLFMDSRPAVAQDKVEPNPNVTIAYTPPRNAALQPLFKRLQERQLLERLSILLSPLRLPKPLKIQTDQCDGLTRVYTPQRGATICYEYVARIIEASAAATKDVSDAAQRERDAKEFTTGAVAQTSLYRVALALLEIYDVPIWGRFTDAADRLAAFVMLQFGPEVAETTLKGMTAYFVFTDKEWTDEKQHAAVFSPNMQRAFNYLCMAHGFDEIQRLTRAELKGAAYIKNFPPGSLIAGQRVNRCIGEYLQAHNAFFTTFWPHVDESKVGPVRRLAILKPGDLWDRSDDRHPVFPGFQSRRHPDRCLRPCWCATRAGCWRRPRAEQQLDAGLL